MRLIVIPILLLCGFSGGCATDSFLANRPPIVYATSHATVAHRTPRINHTKPARVVPVRETRLTPTGHTWYPDGKAISNRWNWIVIHHSATSKGSAACFDKAHKHNGWDELGYHFVIGNGLGSPNGHIEMGSRWHKQKHGAHCKTPDNYFNEHGIGICLVGNYEDTKPTKPQLEALNELLRFLCDKCGISASRVTTHKEVTHKTLCPGKQFPIASIRRSLEAS